MLQTKPTLLADAHNGIPITVSYEHAGSKSEGYWAFWVDRSDKDQSTPMGCVTALQAMDWAKILIDQADEDAGNNAARIAEMEAEDRADEKRLGIDISPNTPETVYEYVRLIHNLEATYGTTYNLSQKVAAFRRACSRLEHELFPDFNGELCSETKE
jgi:hypothetical protein